MLIRVHILRAVGRKSTHFNLSILQKDGQFGWLQLAKLYLSYQINIIDLTFLHGAIESSYVQKKVLPFLKTASKTNMKSTIKKHL